jgi:hypothetical protein
MKKTITLLAVVLFTTTIFAQVPSYVPTSGLAGWYSFTGNANDDSGMGNNGTVNGATLTSGKLGIPNTAYSFDGVSNTIGLVYPFLGGVQSNTFTFHTLLKLNSSVNSPFIWGKTFNWGEVNFGIGSDSVISFVWANSITGNKYSLIISQHGVIQNGVWYDIVVVFQSSTAQLFLNGIPITTNLVWVDQSGTTLSTTNIEASANFAEDAGSSKIGLRNSGGSPGNYFNGIIDEFGIWNRALTSTEIATLFNGNNCNISITSQPSNQNIAIGTNTEFTVITAGTSATYQWQTNLGLGWINLSNAGQYNGVTNDTLTVASTTMSNNNQNFRVVIHDGTCADTSSTAVLTILTSILEINNFKDITISPNPFKSTTTITFSEEQKNTIIKVCDVTGRMVNDKCLMVNGKSVTLDMNGYAKGIYFVRIEDEKKNVVNRKIVVQ